MWIIGGDAHADLNSIDKDPNDDDVYKESFIKKLPIKNTRQKLCNKTFISSAWSSSIHSIQLLSYYSSTTGCFPNILLKPLKSNF